MNVLQFIIDIAAKGDQAVLKKIGAIQQKMGGAEAAAQRLANVTGGGLRKAFMSLPGASFFSNPIVALSTGIGVVAKLGMETEKTATAFSVLAGSEATSAKLLGELNEYADRVGYERTGMAAAAQSMLSYGASAKDVSVDLMRLGDIAMGDKNKLQSLSLAFGQVIGAGRLTGQELLQLVNAGFNPLLELSEMTGKSIGTLKEEMADSKISVEMVRAAFERATGPGGRFEGMMAKIAMTSEGAAKQVKSKFTNRLIGLYDIIKPKVIPALNTAGKAIDGIFNVVDKVANVLMKHGQWLLPVVMAMGAFSIAINSSVIAMKALTAAQAIFNAVAAMNPIGLIITAVAALTGVVIVCWNKFAGFRAAVKTTWDYLKEFGIGVKEWVTDKLQGLLTILEKVRNGIARMFGGARDAVYGFEDKVENGAKSWFNRTGFGKRYRERLAEETKNELSDPKASGGASDTKGLGNLSPTASPSTVANDITTGGTRNTSITLNIGKFWEDINVFPADDMNLNEISRKVLEAINRSLEAATSAAR